MQNLEISRFGMQNLEISRFGMRNLEISRFGTRNLEILILACRILKFQEINEWKQCNRSSHQNREGKQDELPFAKTSATVTSNRGNVGQQLTGISLVTIPETNAGTHFGSQWRIRTL